MQGLLSFDKLPPFSAPLRFFLSAPLFSLAAALLLLAGGPDLLASRWTPSLLAATHLLTIGFMLMVMLGALIQILPVVAGANLARPLLLARGLHGGLGAGALLLAGGFLWGRPDWLSAAALALGLSIALFVVMSGLAFRGVPSTSPTISGIKLALLGLTGAVGLGAWLALGLARGWPLPLPALVDLHAGWALGAWAGTLLAAISYVVVPMFQLTPGYPRRPSWSFPWLMLGLATAWSVAVLFDLALATRLVEALFALAGIAFAGLTLRLQMRRRRARPDATSRYWQLGLGAAILGLAMLLAAAVWPPLAELPGWGLYVGILLLVGGFMSLIIGMLYKIVPFLAWMHLSSQPRTGGAVPSMGKLLGETAMRRQMLVHATALCLLLAAVAWPEALARPAGAFAALASGWLFVNLLGAARRYRQFSKQACPT